MPFVRVRKSAGAGLLLLGLCAGAGGCAAAGSARTDYYASRGIILPSEPGDGSLIAIGPGTPGSAWSGSITLVPTVDSGDLADTR